MSEALELKCVPFHSTGLFLSSEFFELPVSLKFCPEGGWYFNAPTFFDNHDILPLSTGILLDFRDTLPWSARILLVPQSWFEISIKLIFFTKRFFRVIIPVSLFANFKCKCGKNWKFSNILQKVKSYFLPISIILRLIPNPFPKKYKLKPPSIRFRFRIHNTA